MTMRLASDPAFPVHETFLQEAGYFLRHGDLDHVARLLQWMDACHSHNAAQLNLLGVLCDARGESEQARAYYQRAIKACACFAAAQQNLRRHYEMRTEGHTRLPLAIGEPLTDWWLDQFAQRGRR